MRPVLLSSTQPGLPIGTSSSSCVVYTIAQGHGGPPPRILLQPFTAVSSSGGGVLRFGS